MPRIKKLTDEEVVTYSVLDRETSPSDFLNDPELVKDPLPQPYRRIDKILQEIVDDVWQILEKNDKERKIEQSKPRAPKFSPLSALEGLENFNCLCSSNDDNNEFLFVGSNGFVHCIDVATMSVIDKLDLNQQTTEGNSNIISITTAKLKHLVHLITCISDTGYTFMSLFIIDKFYTIQPIVEGLDADRKFQYRKCEISKNCDYIALLAEAKTAINDCLIEVYKCPKEVWFQSIETIETKKQQLNEISSSSDALTTNTSITDTSLEQFPSLAKPVLQCKVKPPLNQYKYQTVNTSNIIQLLKSTEATPDLIGLGTNNCTSKQHLDVKHQLAEKIFGFKLTEDTFNQLNGTKNYEIANIKFNAEFRFLPANRIIQSLVPIIDPHQNEMPISITVCWNNSNQLVFYPLGKVNKELESKYEYNMPFSSPISQVKTSKCKNLIAILLKNNIVVAFDFNLGAERKCAYINNQESIKQIFFLPATISNKTLNLTSAPQIKIDTKLICLTNDGNVYLIDCTMGSNDEPRLIFSPKLANKDDKLVDILLCNNVPDLVFGVSETRKLFLLSIEGGKLICDLDNNEAKFMLNIEDHQLTHSSKNQQLFFKCTSNQTNQTRLLCHSLKMVPILENYFSQTIPILTSYLPINSTLNDRVRYLFKNKIDEQQSRKEKLKNIWNELTNHRNNQLTKN